MNTLTRLFFSKLLCQSESSKNFGNGQVPHEYSGLDPSPGNLDNILFLTMVYWVLTILISPKESGLFSRIVIVTQSEQGNTQHRIFTRNYTTPYVY